MYVGSVVAYFNKLCTSMYMFKRFTNVLQFRCRESVGRYSKSYYTILEIAVPIWLQIQVFELLINLPNSEKVKRKSGSTLM